MKKSVISFLKLIFAIMLIAIAYGVYYSNKTIELKEVCNENLIGKGKEEIKKIADERSLILRDKFNISNQGYSRFLVNKSTMPSQPICELYFKGRYIETVIFLPPDGWVDMK